MSAASNYTEVELQKWFVGINGAMGSTLTRRLALFTAYSNDGASVTEVSGGSYARADLAGKFPTPSGETTANNASIAFPQATADWGNVVAVGIYDAASTGNLLWHAPLAANRNITNGANFSFPSGELTVGVQ